MAAIIECSVQSKWLNAMLDRMNCKKMELRPATAKWIAVKSGDTLVVSCGEREERFYVLTVGSYPSYLTAIQNVYRQYSFPGIATDEEAARICEELNGPLPVGINVIALNLEHIP
jgi:hypothetical protein